MRSSTPDIGIRLSIDSVLEEVFLVGIAVHAYAEYLGFNDSETNFLELAVVEAVNNAIKHAYKGKAGNRVDISVTIPSGWMVITVSCENIKNPDFQWPKYYTYPSEKVSLTESGRGTSIINLVMDDVHLETEKNRQVLIMKKRRPDMNSV